MTNEGRPRWGRGAPGGGHAGNPRGRARAGHSSVSIVIKPEPHEYIQTAADLQTFCKKVSDAPELALDTEFIRENTYYPILEIIQVSDGRGNVAIIDVPAVGDLAPLAERLTDCKQEKIFHSPSQDIEVLRHCAGVTPDPIFDTQLAGAMVGLGFQISYVNMVRELLDRRLLNDQTVSDWSQRPLSQAQLAYAVQDVLWLGPAREQLLARLAELRRIEWFREEQADVLSDMAAGDTTPDDARFRNVKEWNRLDGFHLAVLRELAAWREQEARQRNLPRQQVMPDAALTALSLAAPAGATEAEAIRDVPASKLHRGMNGILEAVARARRLAPSDWPQKHPPFRAEIPIGMVELFQAVVRSTAEAESIAPSLLATTDGLNALAARRHMLENFDSPLLRGWRRTLIGDKLIALMEGRMRLRFRDRDQLTIEE